MKVYRGRYNSGRWTVDVIDVGPGGMIASSRALMPRSEFAHKSRVLHWGAFSADAQHLAFAILADATNNDTAIQLYPSFMVRVLSRLPAKQEWQLTHDQVLQRVRQLEAERHRPLDLMSERT